MTPILIFLCDELRADCLGCYGNSDIDTPNIDRFAGEAVRFENAFASAPVCVPSRTSMATGLYPGSHGALDNSLRTDRPDLTWYNLLRQMGYSTHNYGKLHVNWHAGREDQDRFGMDETVGFPDARGVGYDKPEDYGRAMEYKRLRGYLPLLIYGEQPGKLEDMEPYRVVRAAADRIDALVADGRDFAMVTSTNWPHSPYIAPQPYYGRYQDADIEPFYFRSALASRPRQQQFYYYEAGMDLLTEHELRKSQASYYGRIAAMDGAFGHWLDRLKRSGIYDDALVIFVADHATCLGEHGFIHKVGYLFDATLRVPLLIKPPGNDHAGEVREGLVELIDLYPTILELIGRPGMIPSHVQGSSLVPVMKGDADGKDAVFAEWFEGSVTRRPARMVRTADYKLTLYPDGEFTRGNACAHGFARFSDLWVLASPEGELYDLRDDPREQHNRFDDPAYAEIRKDLTAKIKQWEEQYVMVDYRSVMPEPGKVWTVMRLMEGKNLSRLSLSVRETPDRTRPFE